MDDLTLYYAPRTRSFTALWLMEELGRDYQLESFSLASGRHKQPDYLAMNPMGKVPLLTVGGLPVSELGAIALFLGDRFPDAGLAPPIDDPERPAYLRWVLFASAIIEPAFAQKFIGFEIPPRSAAWGSFEQMLEVAEAGVADGGFLVGDSFSLADVVVASGLGFGINFGIIPREGAIADYVNRLAERDAYKRARAIEAREGERFPIP